MSYPFIFNFLVIFLFAKLSKHKGFKCGQTFVTPIVHSVGVHSYKILSYRRCANIAVTNVIFLWLKIQIYLQYNGLKCTLYIVEIAGTETFLPSA